MVEGIIVNGTWVTWRTPSQVFKKFGSFGISKSHLKRLRDQGIPALAFPVREWNCTYVAPIEQFLDSTLEFRDSHGEMSKHVRLSKMSKVPYLIGHIVSNVIEAKSDD